jgi:hypothetical protein
MTQDRDQAHDGRHAHAHPPRAPGARAMPPELAAVLAEVVPPGGAFRHRQHIHLAFLAVQRHGAAGAADVVARWITHIAAYERAPQKFNATVTRAWTEIVAHHVASGPSGADFASFADGNPALFDKRLLARHYSARLLASPAARAGWVEPDLARFPWRQIAR